MPAPIEPPDLARLVELAERPREHDWSLRAALVRYAQPQPERAGRILEVVRRLEGALHTHAALLAERGDEVWAALDARAPAPGPDGLDEVVGLLRAAVPVDALGEALATWATDPAVHEAPDAHVDEVVSAAAARLDDLGVARADAGRPPRAPRGQGGRRGQRGGSAARR